MTLNIHANIKDKLDYFYKIQKIPNIIFHGPSGCGKRSIVDEFVNKIYDNDKAKIKTFVMSVNCSHGKGIKFIREELKFFAKTHIHTYDGNNFKTIILLNADKLTMDAQSALRRCIELFSHNTRFFIVAEDKYSLMKPILSRFCEIYVSEPYYKGNYINLYKHNVRETFPTKQIKKQKTETLKKEIHRLFDKSVSLNELFQLSSKLYEKGYHGLDILHLLEKTTFFDSQFDDVKKSELLFTFHRSRKTFKHEKLFMLFIFNFLFLSSENDLENISFM